MEGITFSAASPCIEERSVAGTASPRRPMSWTAQCKQSMVIPPMETIFLNIFNMLDGLFFIDLRSHSSYTFCQVSGEIGLLSN